MTNRRKRKEQFVSASELAQMGVCERLVYFESVYGKRCSREQSKARARGDEAHKAFLQEALIINSNVDTGKDVKRWCFIASFAFTVDAPEVHTLRTFRDTFLRKTHVGRVLLRPRQVKPHNL